MKTPRRQRAAGRRMPLATPRRFLYNVPVSWLLKWLYIFRLRCGQALRSHFHKPRPVRPAPLLNVMGVPLPFLEGVNLPWLRYGGDFGANAWNPAGGMALTGKQDELRRHFRELHERGIHLVRWFLFCDGRAGIRFTPAGTPAGPDDRLFADIDAALEIAAAEGMKVIFVLLDFLWFDKASQVNGVQTGGRSRGRHRRLQAAGPAPAGAARPFSSATAALLPSWPGTSSTSPSGPPAAGAGASSAPPSHSWPCAASSRG